MNIKIKFTDKQFRVFIGLIMMVSFMCLIMQIYMFSSIIVLYIANWVIWLPPVLCIGLTYHLLMKVYKYKGVK